MNDTWAPRSNTNGNINCEGYHRGVTTIWVATQTNVNINKHWKFYKLIFSFWSYPSNVGGRVIKTIGLCSPFTKSLPLHMQYYAAVVSESSPAARWHCGSSCGEWWKVFGSPRMHRTPFCFSEPHNSHLLHGNSCTNNCIVWIMKSRTRAEDQKLKIS